MSRGETYDYPSCEADDCYCKRHWPNRSGGDELSVIDNDTDGSKTIRCETAIHNDDDITTCSFCEKYMLGPGMRLPGKFMYIICVRCQDTVTFIDAFAKVFDTRCKYATLFPTAEVEQSDQALVPCETCGLGHVAYDAATEFEDEYTICYEIKNIGHYKTLAKPARDLSEAFNDEIRDQLEKAWQAKRDAKAAINQRKMELEDRCAVARKRLLLTTIPMLAKLTDEEFNAHVPAKFARLISEKEIEITERFCAATEMTTEDVITFTKFLIHGPDK